MWTGFFLLSSENCKTDYSSGLSSGVINKMTESPKTHKEQKTHVGSRGTRESCPPGKIEGIRTVTEPSREFLNERQLVDYREHRKQLSPSRLLV